MFVNGSSFWKCGGVVIGVVRNEKRVVYVVF